MSLHYSGPLGNAAYSAGGGMGGSYSAGGGYSAGMGGGGRAGLGAGGGPIVQGSGGCCGPPAHLSARSMGSGGMYGSGVGGGSGTVLEATPGCGLGSNANDTGCCVGGPETQCGGVGSACLDSSGNMITTTDWSYVGQGRGGYSMNPSYNYVGEGAGAYSKETIVTPYGCRIRPCCLLLALLALLPLLYYLLQPTCDGMLCTMFPALCTSCTVTPPPPGPVGECTLWGDPHIRTFDHIRSDYYSPGEFWVVKSKNVWIQARYLPTKVTSGLGVTKAIAVGGPFLKGHKLFVTVRSANWDAQPVLTGFPSDFSVPGLVDMHYNNVGQLLQAGRSGKPLHIVHIKLEDGSPEGILIQVNRWMEPTEGDYMNVKINMHKQPDQDGHCGNFNGVPTDDDRIQVRARVGKTGVEPAQMLFHTKTPVMIANRPNINDCPAEKLDDAKSVCKAKKQRETGSKWAIPSMDCLIDVCFGGKGFAQTG